MTCIFVYGTLKRGGENHVHLTGQRFLGEAATVPGFTLYDMQGFPGMVRDTGDTAGVTGELWEVDAGCLQILDVLEGVTEGLYARESVMLLPPFADRPAETYLYLRSLVGRPPLGSTWKL